MMAPIDPTDVTHAIQLAVAPVFLLTAVSAMIGVAAGRFARIIDRARLVETKAREEADTSALESWQLELSWLRTRGHLINACIALLTLCAFMIGVTIIVLFLGETTQLQYGRLALSGFICGVVFFLSALFCFLIETFIASRLLNFSILNGK